MGLEPPSSNTVPGAHLLTRTQSLQQQRCLMPWCLAHMHIPAGWVSPWTERPQTLCGTPAPYQLLMVSGFAMMYLLKTMETCPCTAHKDRPWLPCPSHPQTLPLVPTPRAPGSSPCLGNAPEVGWKVALDTHLFGHDHSNNKCILCHDSVNTHS